MQQTTLTSKYGSAACLLVQNDLKSAQDLHQQSLFVGAILDPTTSKQMEYKDLVKQDKYKQVG